MHTLKLELKHNHAIGDIVVYSNFHLVRITSVGFCNKPDGSAVVRYGIAGKGVNVTSVDGESHLVSLDAHALKYASSEAITEADHARMRFDIHTSHFSPSELRLFLTAARLRQREQVFNPMDYLPKLDTFGAKVIATLCASAYAYNVDDVTHIGLRDPWRVFSIANEFIVWKDAKEATPEWAVNADVIQPGGYAAEAGHVLHHYFPGLMSVRAMSPDLEYVKHFDIHAGVPVNETLFGEPFADDSGFGELRTWNRELEPLTKPKTKPKKGKKK